MALKLRDGQGARDILVQASQDLHSAGGRALGRETPIHSQAQSRVGSPEIQVRCRAERPLSRASAFNELPIRNRVNGALVPVPEEDQPREHHSESHERFLDTGRPASYEGGQAVPTRGGV